MDKQPKRRKFYDNPYTLLTENNTYYVIFKDSKNIVKKIKVNGDIFEEFNKYELDDISQMHKFERHIEHFELTEETLYFKTLKKGTDILDLIIKEEQLKRLYNAISNLSNLQKKRIILYYFLENTLDEIARQENCSIHSVFVSIERAKDKIKKFMIS